VDKQERLVLVVAPSTTSRFVTPFSRRDLTLLLAPALATATLHNLSLRLNQGGEFSYPEPSTAREPLSGYYLQSFLRLHGYDARVVFDWSTDEQLCAGLDTQPLAIALSTTFIQRAAALARCIRELRRVFGETPVIVGGPLIWKQRLLLDVPLEERERQLFVQAGPPALRSAVYIGHQFGQHTLLRVLGALRAPRRSQDLDAIPNLILPAADGSLRTTRQEAEPIDLNVDFTRWDLVDAMPACVPLRNGLGCPHHCSFCDFRVLHPTPLQRRPESLLEEIRLATARG
jgi:hypothetical protein